MRTILSALTILVLAVFSVPNAHATDLPPGMAWHMKDGTCNLSEDAKSGKIYPFLKGCFYGKPGEEENIGILFFRVCSTLPGSADKMARDAEPFLAVEFDWGIYTLQYRGRVLDVGALPNGGFDPMPKFKSLFGIEENIRNCWAPEYDEEPV